ncbi:MAG: CTP synthase [Deferribacteraceae bacterium]|jgi:CTP synthase|nr:CTP synthase [Deferribacteraceae bacterium]
MMAKFIFVTGGVVSSLGKGMSAATIGALLKARGFKVRIRKLDPYLNIDPGTMSPLQHGEVYVTEDGAETDLDLGHYERFLSQNSHSSDSISGGKIYYNVLMKERRGDYLGATVQMIPNVTDEIKEFISSGMLGEDFVICEVGGTVGDIESLVFLEAIRQYANDIGRRNAMFIHVTLLPYIDKVKELKTKPTQHSVKNLLEKGIQADMLLCRSTKPFSEGEREKLALFCNIERSNIIPAIDVDSVYKLPELYYTAGVDQRVLEHFNIKSEDYVPDMNKWEELAKKIDSLKDKVNIALVVKYGDASDAYKSLNEALHHSAWAENLDINIKWINTETLENTDDMDSFFRDVTGIIVPGGFGERGTVGKMKGISYARVSNIPYFGICFGLQLAVIEFARNVVGIKDANTTEFEHPCSPVISLMTEWISKGEIEKRSQDSDKGGTLRLGSYPCRIVENTLAHSIYNTEFIHERHRHRYEMNTNYEAAYAEKGLHVTGRSPDGVLPEIIELKTHPFFLGVQFHPEFKSTPFKPHPIFSNFLRAAKRAEKQK